MTWSAQVDADPGGALQAGPSKAMNWYDTNGQGASHPAGPRANCPDSMNGNAVMYDAVQGLILTVGGAPSYQVRPLREGSFSPPSLNIVIAAWRPRCCESQSSHPASNSQARASISVSEVTSLPPG